MTSILLTLVPEQLYFPLYSREMDPGALKKSIKAYPLITGNHTFLRRDPCAIRTTACLLIPTASLSLDKMISSGNSPGQSWDQVYGRAVRSGAQAPLQFKLQWNKAANSSHPAPRAWRALQCFSQPVFVWMPDNKFSIRSRQGFITVFSSASDTGRWATRWRRAGWLGSWTGRSPFGLAPPLDSTPCFHAYREIPPPEPALPPLEKARGRSSPWSRSWRTPAGAEERKQLYFNFCSF